MVVVSLFQEGELRIRIDDDEILGNEQFEDEDADMDGNFNNADMVAAQARGQEKQLHIMRNLAELAGIV